MSDPAPDSKATAVQTMQTGTLANAIFLDKDKNEYAKRPIYLYYEPSEEVMGSIYWNEIRTRIESRKFPLASLTDVYEGKKTPAFDGSEAPATSCCSIASKKTNTALHLEAATQVERDTWIKGLKDIFAKKSDSEAAQALKKGYQFTGYFFGADLRIIRRPIFVFYEMESSFGAFYWNEVRNKEGGTRFPLHTVTDVFPLKKTLAMKSAAAAEVDGKCALSLESRKTEQGVHIEMPSEAMRKTWLDGLQHVFTTKVKARPQSPAAATTTDAAATQQQVQPAQAQPVTQASAAAPAAIKQEEKVSARPVEVKAPEKKSMAPVRVDLMDGKDKYICRCGQSKNFPYCDGSHDSVNKATGSNWGPLKVNRMEFGASEVWISAGREPKNLERGFPFWDGSHAKLVDLEHV